MNELSICRCCAEQAEQGLHRDLYTRYNWLDKSEIYSNMLKECYNIIISTSDAGFGGICDACIATLRSALNFKHQVLLTEKEFLKKLHGLEEQKEVKLEELKLFEVKQEPNVDSGDESDDYYLADTAREIAKEKIKTEDKNGPDYVLKMELDTRSGKKPVSNKKTVRKKSNRNSAAWKTDKIKSLVTRLATSINFTELPKSKTERKRSDITTIRKLKVDSSNKQTNLNLVWTKAFNEKRKHVENLETILKYSNAVPFKGKSLLGFMCSYCKESYPDPEDLRRHTFTYHKKERQVIKSNFHMSEYQIKLDVTNLTCSLCDKHINNLTIFKDHIVKTHGKVFHNDIKDHLLQFKLKQGDINDCCLCSSTYETFKTLKQHMNTHYCNYTCNKCDTSFATKRSLNSHLTTHQEGSFKCDHCEKIFPSRAKKHYHEKCKHFGARNISNCPHCNEPFRSYYQRNQHLIKVHNAEARYKCNVCDKGFVLKSLLMSHIKKSHLLERNCQCTECGFRFFSTKSLKAHMVKHTGEKNYTCEVCHKAYARKYTLREHMRIHNNDRRFKCDVCNMTFVQKCSLKSHLLSNHGISMAASDISSNTVKELDEQ